MVTCKGERDRQRITHRKRQELFLKNSSFQAPETQKYPGFMGPSLAGYCTKSSKTNTGLPYFTFRISHRLSHYSAETAPSAGVLPNFDAVTPRRCVANIFDRLTIEGAARSYSTSSLFVLPPKAVARTCRSEPSPFRALNSAYAGSCLPLLFLIGSSAK